MMNCSETQEIADDLKNILDMPSPVNIERSFPMWTMKNYQVDCDDSLEDLQPVKFYFNYKDICTFGTCLNACYYLNLTNSANVEQCKRVCKLNVLKSPMILNNQRNAILAYIAHEVEGRRVRFDSAVLPNEILSMNVVVQKSDYSSTVVYGSSSPFCFTRNG